MKQVIWKFELKVACVQDIEIPSGSILLSVQAQNNKPCLWALIRDPNARKETIRLRTINTGNPIYEVDFNYRDFLGTYQTQEGRYVGHVFQVTM